MIDISRSLTQETAPWPGDVPLSVAWTLRLSEGDTVSLSSITLSTHLGTHADAPAHYRRDGAPVAEFDLAAFIGPARVIDLRGSESITTEALEAAGAITVSRLLVRGLDTVRPELFASEFPALSPDAAAALVDAGLRLYGTDAPSVDPKDSKTMSAHNVLGAVGIPILENLDLSQAEPGDYDLVALPLKLMETEATPVRAVLLPPGSVLAAQRDGAAPEPSGG